MSYIRFSISNRRVNMSIATLLTSLLMSVTALGSQINQPQSSFKKRISALSSSEQELRGEHHQNKKISAAERRPRSPMDINARFKYGSQNDQKSLFLNRPSSHTQKVTQSAKSNRLMAAPAPAAACDTQLFASSSGSSLINAVKSSTTECVNTLFSVTGTTAGQIFNESKMVTIADAFKNSAIYYDGTNSSSSLQLILFLRAGYYVNWSESASTGPYGTALKNSVQSALDAFVSNGNFGLVNDVHGEILSEFVTLIDSSSENARYLSSVVKRLLTNYNSSYNAYWWMKSALNNVFTVLFRGHQNADFVTLIKSDTSIVDSLYNFINGNFNLLGGDQGYLISNAGRELGRFLQYADNTSIKSIAKSRAKLLIDRSNVTGSTASLWVGVGEMIDYYDKPNCSYYHLCDFVTRLETNVLPISHSCSPTLRLRAQSLTSSQLTEACTIVGGEESYFHTQAATGKIPVANDNNKQLEMVVFSSSNDYGTYAGAIFGIDTNNGGMYLEGDPSLVTNQPRFIAYQAEWMLPKFEIWNLTHEYVHYLDGRFNLYGDFNAAMGVNSVWWIEGFAEYMSYSYRNLAYDGAKTQAAAGTYSLSTIFKNDYNSGQTRVYNWGYLAVRYLFEKQRNKVSSLLGYFRPGNWTGYASYMNGSFMNTSMDANFKAWLPCVNNASLPNCLPNTNNTLPVAQFVSTISGLTVNFTDQSTDSDGTIASRNWTFGDGTSSTNANPSKTYANSGTYSVNLTVTDNNDGKALISKNITVNSSPVNSLPVAQFVSTISGLTVNFTDQSTDSDGTIASRNWTFGDGTSSTNANPSKTYANSGTYTVNLNVTDNQGGKATTSRTVVVQGGTSGLPECAGSSQALGKDCVRSNVSGNTGDYAYMYLYVPANTRRIIISSSGGTGNADLYVNTLGQWATRNAHNYRSTNSGNTESVTVDYPPSGYIYVSLFGTTAFSGTQVKVQFY